MKKIFALIAFALTVLCSTPAFAMGVKKRSADEIEQEDSHQNSPFATPRANSPVQTEPGAPGKERTMPSQLDWLPVAATRELFHREDVSEEAPIDYAGLEFVEIVPETPAAPRNNEEFEAAFAGMDEAQ
jgi:hypothetical protein